MQLGLRKYHLQSHHGILPIAIIANNQQKSRYIVLAFQYTIAGGCVVLVVLPKYNYWRSELRESSVRKSLL